MFGKKNVITFYTNEVYEGNLDPIYPAYKHFPEWYGKSRKKSKCPFASFFDNEEVNIPNIKPDQHLDLNKLITDFHQMEREKIIKSNKLISNPQTLMRDTTIVNCPGITDFLKTGYIVPAWSDMAFRKYRGQIIFNLSENYPDVTHGVHVSDQYKGMKQSELPLVGGFHKVSTPWIVKTSPGISLMITHPYWSRNNTFTSVSAIVHSDKTPVVLKWFFEFNNELPDTPDVVNMNQQIIKRGTPLILLIPFKREKIKHQIEYLSPENMQKMYRNTTSATVSWISDTLYNKDRKQIGNLYK